MKLRVTLEIEVSDLPQSEREGLADGLHFRADNDETLATDLGTVPRLEDYAASEITELPYGFFEGMSEYDVQAEIWAGTDLYVYFSKIEVKDVMIVTEAEPPPVSGTRENTCEHMKAEVGNASSFDTPAPQSPTKGASE